MNAATPPVLAALTLGGAGYHHGADIAMLSQYVGEEEVLPPPSLRPMCCAMLSVTWMSMMLVLGTPCDGRPWHAFVVGTRCKISVAGIPLSTTRLLCDLLSWHRSSPRMRCSFSGADKASAAVSGAVPAMPHAPRPSNQSPLSRAISISVLMFFSCALLCFLLAAKSHAQATEPIAVPDSAYSAESDTRTPHAPGEICCVGLRCVPSVRERMSEAGAPQLTVNAPEGRNAQTRSGHPRRKQTQRQPRKKQRQHQNQRQSETQTASQRQSQRCCGDGRCRKGQ